MLLQRIINLGGLLSVLVMLGIGAVLAEPLSGRVVGVIDGDSLKIVIDGRQTEVRLAGIDAPEKGQPYGARAKQVLADLVYGRDVMVQAAGVDRYRRTLATIYLDGRSVNAAMVEAGAAWVYTAYTDDARLLQLQEQAQQQQSGLWQLPSGAQIPPWEWRRGRRSATAEPAAVEKRNYSCSSKQYCSQMTSCDEALWYLRECGVQTLDGDGDGRPCEVMCR